MRDIRIGILGFGTVGAGVVEGLQKNGELIAARTGIRPVIAKIADLDIESDRGIALPEGILTQDAASVIADESVDVIVELVGGTTVAITFTEQALALGKPVVTANKALLADHGDTLYALAEEKDTGIYYEAAVGGGIPILRAQRDGLVGNEIEEIFGILNGTCNYILTRMEAEGLDFDTVLKDAQALGYAETPPDLDIDGIDTAHKAVILASMAYGTSVPMSACPTSGIRGLERIDISHAASLGYRIKLLAIIKRGKEGVELSVEPALVPISHMIGSVNDSFNAVFVKGDIVDETMYYGRGAGRAPTGSAVIGDILEAARDVLNDAGSPVGITMLLQHQELAYLPAEQVQKRAYVRISLADEPGAMGEVMKALGTHHINVASVIQPEQHPSGSVPVIILTEKAREVDFVKAMQEIEQLDCCVDRPVRMRLEDFEDESS